MDFSFESLFGGLLFSAIGLIGWRIGRQRNSVGKMILGVALMGYTFVTPGGLWIWAVGAGLTVALVLVP